MIDFVNKCLDDDFEGVNVRRHVEQATSHGRDETRTYTQFPVPESLKGRERWSRLKTIGVVVYQSTYQGRERFDVRYYISSLHLGVKQFSRAVRKHWSIENSRHWSLDVTYREDALRTRNRQLAENLAWIRRFTLSLLKQHPSKDSLAMKRRRCGWNDEFLMQVLTGMAFSVRWPWGRKVPLPERRRFAPRSGLFDSDVRPIEPTRSIILCLRRPAGIGRAAPRLDVRLFRAWHGGEIGQSEPHRRADSFPSKLTGRRRRAAHERAHRAAVTEIMLASLESSRTGRVVDAKSRLAESDGRP